MACATRQQRVAAMRTGNSRLHGTRSGPPKHRKPSLLLSRVKQNCFLQFCCIVCGKGVVPPCLRAICSPGTALPGGRKTKKRVRYTVLRPRPSQEGVPAQRRTGGQRNKNSYPGADGFAPGYGMYEFPKSALQSTPYHCLVRWVTRAAACSAKSLKPA